MNSITLSIIIPFYGNADKRLLERCLQSVREQGLTDADYEVIIADDNGHGVSEARNIGTDKANGRYILYVDADDTLMPGTLGTCLEQVKKYDADILSFGYSYEEEDNSGTCRTDVYSTGAEYMVQHNFLGAPWRHLLRTEWLRKNNLRFVRDMYHEDEAFVARCYALAGTTVITDRCVYHYYRTPGSRLLRADEEIRKRRLNDFFSVLTELQEFAAGAGIGNNNLSETAAEAVLRRMHFLTIDYTLQMLRNRCRPANARRRFKELRAHGLLPLPAKGYSRKYNAARIVINLISRLITI